MSRQTGPRSASCPSLDRRGILVSSTSVRERQLSRKHHVELIYSSSPILSPRRQSHRLRIRSDKSQQRVRETIPLSGRALRETKGRKKETHYQFPSGGSHRTVCATRLILARTRVGSVGTSSRERVHRVPAREYKRLPRARETRSSPLSSLRFSSVSPHRVEPHVERPLRTQVYENAQRRCFHTIRRDLLPDPNEIGPFTIVREAPMRV